MDFNPWRTLRMVHEQFRHALDAVRRLSEHNRILSQDVSLLRRELSLAHAALRRKNVRLKRLEKAKHEASQ